MNTGKKILGKHIRQFIHKNNVFVCNVFDFLVVEKSVYSCKTAAKKDKNACSTCKFVFLLIRSVDLDAIFIAVPVYITSIINQSFAFSLG